jgi:hypothetical protein
MFNKLSLIELNKSRVKRNSLKEIVGGKEPTVCSKGCNCDQNPDGHSRAHVGSQFTADVTEW